MKQKRFLTVVSLLLVVCMLLPFAACTQQDVQSIELDRATLTINVGEEQTLSAMVIPDSAASLLGWQSSNNSIATVDSGKVKGIAEGTALIRATAGTKRAECTVTVVDPNKEIEAESVVLSQTSLTLPLNSVATLTASVLPIRANQTITWSSNRPDIASVNSGTVTALANGVAIITASASNGVYAQCTVTCGAGAVISGVTIDPSAAELSVGKTVKLQASVQPADADQSLSWTTSDQTVATVDNEGLVTAQDKGTATITATAADGVHSATCTITVGDVAVESIEGEPAEMTLTLGGAPRQFSVILNPTGAVAQKTEYQSDDEDVATVDENGMVSAVSEGSATITVTVDGKFTAECQVTVIGKQTIAVDRIEGEPKEMALTLGGAPRQFSVILYPTGAVAQTIEYQSDNEGVASVNDNGIVTAVSEGSATITVTVDGKFTAECNVTVSQAQQGGHPVESVTLDKDQIELEPEATMQLHATVLPEDATDKTVSWSSNIPSVARVDQQGLVTAVSKGTAIITVTTNDGQHTATCTVTVLGEDGNIPVSSVTLDEEEITLSPNEERQLTATVLPENAADKTVVWSSSTPSVARVTQTGKVMARSTGDTTITVTTNDGQYTATCTVHVVTKVTGVSLNYDKLELSITQKQQLQATVTPASATDKTLSWSSTADEIASVDGQGMVTAHKAGQATIKVTTHDGNFSAECVVTVVIKSDTLLVSKVESLTTRKSDFIMGMDASAVPALEAARATNNLYYKNFEGEVEDVFQILKDNGITDIRIRVWNDPYDTSKRGYGGGNCDVENAVTIAKRCEAVGLGVIIDFHYSDFWADPGKQKAPKAWASLSTSSIATEIYNFTYKSLEKIKATGVKITMVQVGNEINGGLAGTTDWSKNASVICNYVNQGSKAVRAVAPEAKVAVHFANPESAGSYMSFAGYLNTYGVDYDVFGSSYYPQWHGTLANLANVLTQVHSRYNKEVMVLETSWAFTNDDFDGFGNTSLAATYANDGLPTVSVQGQANHVANVIRTISDLGEWGIGICYWEGTWIAASTSKSTATNGPLCTQYGCGWASGYAHSYDSSAPSLGSNGGCVIDNQAFWRSDGTPIESLKVFALVKTGNAQELKADSIADTEDYYTVGVGSINLPANVEVTLNDGSVVSVPANWDVTDEQLEQYINEVGEHIITGTTRYGGTARFHAWVMNVNLLEGGSFEDDDAAGIQSQAAQDKLIQNSGLGKWQKSYTADSSGDLQLYISREDQNARMGTNSFHFWDSGTVDFQLYQKVDISKLTEYGDGKFTATFEFQGDSGASINIHAYIKVTYNDGTEAKTFEGTKVSTFSGWQNWQRVSVSAELELSKIVSIEVGISIYAKCASGTEGPWGNIDNAQFFCDHE